MKTRWQKALVVPLIMAAMVAPLCAQDNAGNETNASATNESTPPDQVTTNGATNDATAAQKKHKGPGDHTPVRIDGTGIHVGGPDPVDIDVNMPGLPNPGGFGKSGIPISAVIISVVAILTPFVFLAVCVGFFLYFKFRRNRMLHETIRQMIDKGVPIPPELLAPPAAAVRRKVRSDLRNGLVMLAIGLGLAVIHFRAGGVLMFVGAAFLIIWYVEKKTAPDNNDAINK
jgi:hypothetical protein